MSQPKIILHWLNASRSNRILWLLELLNVDYEVKVYYRTAEYKAPKEIEKVHPLGKFPVIEVVREGKENKVIAETGRIIEYIVNEFDNTGKLTPSTADGKGDVSYFLHYTEGTLQPLLTSYYVVDAANAGEIGAKINAGYFGPEAIRNLDFLEGILAKSESGYFVDNKLTAADVVLTFPIVDLVFGAQAFELFSEPPKERYPNLYKWTQLILADPLYKKTDEIIKAKSQSN